MHCNALKYGGKGRVACCPWLISANAQPPLPFDTLVISGMGITNGNLPLQCQQPGDGDCVDADEDDGDDVDDDDGDGEDNDEDDGDGVAESITSVNCGSVRLPGYHKKHRGTVLARTWNWPQKLKVKNWPQKLKVKNWSQNVIGLEN